MKGNITVVKGLQSEVYVPIAPLPVWAPVETEIKDMQVALITAAGVHRKTDQRYNLAGDHTYREIPGDTDTDELMVTHGGYDNADANSDINCMFPLDRLRELEKEGFVKKTAPTHFGFMGGGGDQKKLKEITAPEIVQTLQDEGVNAVVLTAG